MENDSILSDHEEKSCELCFKIAMLYNRRERLIGNGAVKLGVRLDIQIKQLLKDLKGWQLKENSK